MKYYSIVEENNKENLKKLKQTIYEESQKQYIEGKKPDTKEYILYESMYIKFRNRQIIHGLSDMHQWLFLQNLGGRWRRKVKKEPFLKYSIFSYMECWFYRGIHLHKCIKLENYDICISLYVKFTSNFLRTRRGSTMLHGVLYLAVPFSNTEHRGKGTLHVSTQSSKSPALFENTLRILHKLPDRIQYLSPVSNLH